MNVTNVLRQQEMELIQKIAKEHQQTIVMVTHELATIMSIATNAIYVDSQTKKTIQIGKPSQAIKNTKNPQIINFLYAGKGGKR